MSMILYLLVTARYRVELAAIAQSVVRRIGREILTGSNNFILSCYSTVGSAQHW